MSDYKAGGNNGNTAFGQERGSVFFNFAKPYFDYIGKGRIYTLVYVVMALLNLLVPLAVIFVVIQSGYMRHAGTSVVIAFIVLWLIIAFASWIGFQLWWYRKSSVKNFESKDFIATPVVSDILQTFGECLGTFVGIVGAGAGIIAVFFLGHAREYLFHGFSFLRFGPLLIAGGPVAGFFILLIFRFIAEQIRIFAAIANNTKQHIR